MKKILRKIKKINKGFLYPFMITGAIVVICCIWMLVSKLSGSSTPVVHEMIPEGSQVDLDGVEGVDFERGGRELQEYDTILDNPVENKDQLLSFEIDFKSRLTTKEFVAKENYLRIVTQAMFGNEDSRLADIDEGRQFSVELYHVTDQGLEHESGYVGSCDNVEGGLEFEVEQGEKYRVLVQSKDFASYECLLGHGHLYPVGY